MKHTPYGTVLFYSEHFSDILADIGDETDDPVNYRANCLAGLVDALKSWVDYHSKAAVRYQEFINELHTIVKDV